MKFHPSRSSPCAKHPLLLQLIPIWHNLNIPTAWSFQMFQPAKTFLVIQSVSHPFQLSFIYILESTPAPPVTKSQDQAQSIGQFLPRWQSEHWLRVGGPRTQVTQANLSKSHCPICYLETLDFVIWSFFCFCPMIWGCPTIYAFSLDQAIQPVLDTTCCTTI